MKVTSLSEKLLFGTIKIETTIAPGVTSSGTGFIFLISDDENPKKELYIVTNKHVVKNPISGTLKFILEDDKGRPDYQNAVNYNLDKFESQWFGHGNIIEDEITDTTIDVAIMPFAPIYHSIYKQTGKNIYFGYTRLKNIPTQKDIDEIIDAMENIVFIGYPDGLIDEFNNTPIVRKGITATPYALDFNGQKKFLVDASVFGGSSGSPVYILQETIYRKKGSNIATLADKFFFIGIVARVYQKHEFNEIHDVPVDTKKIAHNKQMIDLGIVFKPETILETIEQYKQTLTK